MRLFAAIELSEQEREPLLAVQHRLAGNTGVRFTRPENLHLTLRFFGKWPEERLPDLVDALEAIDLPTSPLAAPLQGLRFLPGPHYPQVFIALAEAPPPLLALQSEIEACARKLGMRPENKPYLPHVTLGRLRDPKRGQALVEQVEKMKAELGTIEFRGFALISSDLRPEGPRYTAVKAWQL